MTPNEWILSGDTGVSSKTIWAVFMGAADAKTPFGFGVPLDPGDFGRCYRLLKHFPEWRNSLHKVALRFKHWGPLIREWERLEKLYEEELTSVAFPKLYSMMKELVKEGKELV